MDSVEDLQWIDDNAVLFDFTSIDFHFSLLMNQIPSISDLLLSVSQMFLNHSFDLETNADHWSNLSSITYIVGQPMFRFDCRVGLRDF